MPKQTSQLLDILNKANPAKRILGAPAPDRGLAEAPHYPLLALVGQTEMKLALVLNTINPLIGGVLLIGPRGTGKTTAVRGLIDLLPDVQRSTCPNGSGCEPEAVFAQGTDAICSDCAEKLGRGEPIVAPDRMRLIELPLNANLDDVIGGVNERVALEQSRVQLQRGTYFITFLFLLCGASRLARFNISENPIPKNPGRPDRKYFVGLPTPAAAALVAAVVYASDCVPIEFWPLSVAWLALVSLLAFLMVSTWRYRSLKDIQLLRPLSPLAVILWGAIFYLTWNFSQPVLLGMACFYVGSGIVVRLGGALRRRLRHARHPEPQRQPG